MGLSGYAIKHPVTTLMGMAVLILLGVISLLGTPLDLMPDIQPPILGVLTTLPGASPQEVDALLGQPLSGSLGTVPGVQSITSISNEHITILIAEFAWGADLTEARNDIGQRLDQARLPEGANRPSVIRFDPTMMPVIQASVTSSAVAAGDLYRLLDEVIKPALSSVDGVADVQISGGSPSEIHVQVDPADLREHGVSMEQLRGIIQGTNLTLPAGTAQTEGRHLPLRVMGGIKDIDDLSNLAVSFTPDLAALMSGGGRSPLSFVSGMASMALAMEQMAQGQMPADLPLRPLRLAEVADVRMGQIPQTSIQRTNGERALGLTIQKEGQANTVDVSQAVRERFSQLETAHPGLNFHVFLDQGEFIEMAVESVSKSLLVGGFMAVLVLLFFLRSFTAMLTIGIAIPFSIIVTFVLIYFQGLTINIMTLGGLALGVGMLVDNAIVVIESIHRRRQELGEDPATAAERGANDVARAITAATLTTVAVFLPIAFVGGISGQLFKELALTVTFSLLASLLVSLTVIPMLASRLRLRENKEKTAERRGWYARLLDWALAHRALTLLGATAALALSLTLIPFIGTEFMPGVDDGSVRVNLQLPPGTSLDEIEQMVSALEARIVEEIETDLVVSQIGSGGGMAGMGMMGGGGRSASLTIIPSGNQSSRDLINRLEHALQAVVGDAGEVNLTATSQMMMLGGSDQIQVEVTGPDLARVTQGVQAVRERMAQINGVIEIEDNLERVRPELQVVVDREAALRAGLAPATIGMTVSSLINGTVVTRIAVDGRPTEVRVGQFLDRQPTAQEVKDMRLTGAIGDPVRLGDIAEVIEASGPVRITRQNGQIRAEVSATVSGRDLGGATTEVQRALDDLSLPAGVSTAMGGASAMMQESLTDLVKALLLAIVLIYMIMAAQFESLRNPLIILASMPLAVIGVLLAHWLTRYALGVTSMIGLIILAGIVVNNAIVLIDRIGQLRQEGHSVDEAVKEACRVRVRPILMTAATTILGLLPLSIGLGEAAEIMAPMALAVIGGLLTSTLLTLVVVPVLYHVINTPRAARV